MSTIFTVTVNPAIDISAHVPVLKPDRKLHCTGFKKEPGGGGINVSRVLKRFGAQTTAVYLAGGYSGEYLTSMLQAEHINTLQIETGNHTRENFVISENASGLQYRFGMPGPLVHENEWKKCLYELSKVKEAEYIVASGSLSEGVPDDFFAEVAKIAKINDARFILDTSGQPLKEALKVGAFLIKPNLGELSELVGLKELNKETAVFAAREIISKGQCGIIVISMGAAGALLVTRSITEYIPAPVVKIKSAVGAGDSMVAGMVLALSKNKQVQYAVKYGVACGAAATINEGTALCKQEDVNRLFTLINNNC